MRDSDYFPPYFSRPYPNETFHSMVARNASHQGILDSQLSKYFFGIRNGVVDHLFPNKLHEFELRIGRYYGLSSTDIIHNHTLYPFYSRFFSETKNQKVLKSMLQFGYEAGKNFNYSSYDSKSIKFCPNCFEEDLALYPERFWRLDHNIPDLLVCTRHQLYLDNRKCINGENYVSRMYYDANNLNLLTFQSKICTNSELLSISNDLVNSSHGLCNRAMLKEKAFAVGFLRKKNSKNFIPPLILARFTNYVNSVSITYTKRCLSREAFKMFFVEEWTGLNPIVYLLLKRFIGALPKFLAKNDNSSFKCINKVCTEFGKISITEFSFSEKSDRYTVNCKSCGHIYTVRKNKLKETIKIVRYSQKLIDYSIELYKNGVSTEEIYRKLHVPEKSLLKFCFEISSETMFDSKSKNFNRQSLRDHYIFIANSDSHNNLRAFNLKTYFHFRWMITYDFVWYSNYKTEIWAQKSKSNREYYSDLKAFDESLYVKVCSEYNKLIKSKYRITRNLLLRRSGVTLTHSKRMKLLKKTNTFIKAHAESLKEFYERKLNMILSDRPHIGNAELIRFKSLVKGTFPEILERVLVAHGKPNSDLAVA